MIAWGQSMPTRLSASAGSDGRSPESSIADSLADEIFSIVLAGTSWRRASIEVAFAMRRARDQMDGVTGLRELAADHLP